MTGSRSHWVELFVRRACRAKWFFLLLAAVATASPAWAQRKPESKAASSKGKKEGASGKSKAATSEATARFLECIDEAEQALKGVRDYTATFAKKELVGKKLVQQQMAMKFRETPFSVYFLFTSEEEKGREVIYVDGKYKNELVVHETGLKGLAGTLRFKPSHSRVMGENRYHITDVGIGNILKKASEQFERDATDHDLHAKVYPKAKLDDVPCTAVVIKHAKAQKDWAYSDIRVYYDQETKLPIHVERYGWPARPDDQAPLLEEYSYRDLKLNVGLKDIDFDPKNPQYNY